ncbi:MULTISPECIES: L-threonylcarbamoyladenylate synthase [Cyanophyceae]|jgi:tRNA threonylcarbamoyl adenosine modification protein (Sua5/YciO/YrdC/YwlC family)|uniref:L-threonylcarbamoyladenylate synthase n=1 Tax=Cyanophyceae TaxID=3028117 RepID=UPI00168A1F2C|nr:MULTISPECIES: L-threonylcarbamoyladenylate synthase [unclassified Trichocoleus]MBD1832268.1 threonylcarbamoyl-AMP synthase [Cyanobacteria bacterium FACHB-472]MBD1931358.1 threonylcarbamoyl-AMP synthase [Trichocoleus sp. FACHB-69]MBD2006525.1 threonylcarbamoyl-AMP synthase [Trichocoleus sp. FACHB-40]
MATIYTIHPDTPQTRRIEQIVKAMRDGAVILYPTDTVYAIGCDINVKSAVERVRRIKQLSNDKPLTFLCPSLSNIAQYAIVTDAAYRIMRNLIPGPYTFVLPATKLVPRLVMNPKRKTTGIRVPDHIVCQSLLQALGNPIISTSAHLSDENGDTPIVGLEKAELFDQLDNLVDVIVDDDSQVSFEVSTILDLTEQEPVIVRKGLGWEAATAWATSVS